MVKKSNVSNEERTRRYILKESKYVPREFEKESPDLLEEIMNRIIALETHLSDRQKRGSKISVLLSEINARLNSLEGNEHGGEEKSVPENDCGC